MPPFRGLIKLEGVGLMPCCWFYTARAKGEGQERQRGRNSFYIQSWAGGTERVKQHQLPVACADF